MTESMDFQAVHVAPLPKFSRVQPILRAGAALLVAATGAVASPDDGRSEVAGQEPETHEEASSLFTNPYDGIDWEAIGYHDANLHTHTNFSDGLYDPHYAIDTYHDLDYEILALTDHDSLHVDVWPRALYPWTELNDIFHQIKDEHSIRFDMPYGEVADEEWQNRDPGELGMVSVPGSEISRTHHIGSLFSVYAGGAESEETAFEEIGERGGIAVFNHPGRYDREVDWYIDFFKRREHVVGMEVYNQVDRYPMDRAKWDRILHRLMPERPVWGFANDDTHSDDHFGRNRNVFMLTELSEEKVFGAIQNGHFYFFVPVDQGTPPPVRLTGAEAAGDTIRLQMEGSMDRIEWITYDPALGESRTVATGPAITRDNLPPRATFVRAVIISEEGRTYTQPFGVKKE